MLQGRVTRATLARLLILGVGNLALLLAIWWLLKPGASYADVLRGLIVNTAPTILAGLGLTAVVMTGAIDLSIGAIVAVAAAVFGVLAARGWHPAGCFVACWATACGLSLLNGYLIRGLRIPAIILTLGGLSCYRGLALIIADLGIPEFTGSITLSDAAYHTPGRDHSGWILLTAVVLFLVWVGNAKLPRLWLAVGNSEEACRRQGLRPEQIVTTAFAASGLLLGLASLLMVTDVQTIKPARLAIGFELGTIGAVVLGGTNIFGGEGSFVGTVLGALFLYLAAQTLDYAEVNIYYQQVVMGASILLVIGFDCLWHRQHNRREELA